MSQRQRAGGLAKRIIAEDVAAGLVGDDFDFTVSSLKQIVLNGCEGITE